MVTQSTKLNEGGVKILDLFDRSAGDRIEIGFLDTSPRPLVLLVELELSG